ncbi:restriction endonuclease [Flavobacterium oreochromis]|uniref:McrC family protein n=1 Tax=Flavobacterium oreochromis TaxID=2906078 RepID=UPI00385C2796
MSKAKCIHVYEYSTLLCGQVYDEYCFEETHFNALVKLNEVHKNKYFIVGLKKITFKNYVGVLQVDGLVIEVLPKIDQYESETDIDKKKWQNALIDMLRVTKHIKDQKVGEAFVSKQSKHLLDIYFEWFLNEVQLLLHQGLIKQYNKETGNVKALKGKLEFAGHLTKNLVHKERFYTTHQVYDKDHLLHQVLYCALAIIASLAKGSYLYSMCKKIQLDFPEVKTIRVTAKTFEQITYNRKTAPYETAVAIAKIIILNYAPNVKNGSENMLALLFDMNVLWEQYILARLQNAREKFGFTIKGQNSKRFWENILIRPDIVLSKGVSENFIIDTKWKNIDQSKPSTQDLRQMYVYNEYWNSKKAMLLYPTNGDSSKIDEHSFTPFNFTESKLENHRCCLAKINIFEENKLNEKIGDTILEWFTTP